MTAQPEAVATAKNLGFAGVEVSLGPKVEGDKLPLDNPEILARYRKAFQEHNFRPAARAWTCCTLTI